VSSTRPFLVVIPARYSSTRFPGKALADLGGKTVIQRCIEQCAKAVSLNDIVVATDDQRIADACSPLGVQVEMTSSDCLTGTDRVAEVACSIPAQWYVNVQGDEPFLEPRALNAMVEATRSSSEDVSVINSFAPITSDEEFRSVTVPKVVCNQDGYLLYASRAAIPTTKNLDFVSANRQIGMYAFRANALAKFALQAEKTPLERLEDIEVLRFLEMGFRVRMIEVPSGGIAIDTPEDLRRAAASLEVPS
jgi:3-deoxy-manno-octulosonate cytidylyltransferase (CMP-KDO synthetase)